MEQARYYDKDKHETQTTRRIHKRSSTLEQSVRKLLEGLNIFDDSNLTHISNSDQDSQMSGLHEEYPTQ